jgi:hypothetical protein
MMIETMKIQSAQLRQAHLIPRNGYKQGELETFRSRNVENIATTFPSSPHEGNTLRMRVEVYLQRNVVKV